MCVTAAVLTLGSRVLKNQGRDFFVEIEIDLLNNPWGIMPEKTPLLESGISVDYDLPAFPKSLHTVGTQARRSLTFVRPLKGCS